MFVMPAACMKRCMPRNGALPGPADEKVSPPEVDFARSMNSFTVFTGKVGRHQHVVILLTDYGDWLEVLDRIVGQGLQVRRDHEGVGAHQQRVSVSRRLVNGRGGDNAVRARPIFHRSPSCSTSIATRPR